MLIQFNFKNFKSFREENSLDMTATPIKEHSYNLIDLGSGGKYLRVAAIYGANASGKSNMIEALQYMQFFVLASLGLEEFEKYNASFIPVRSFIFDNSSKNSPSEFEVFLVKNDIEYQYGFILEKERVHEEWLYYKSLKAKKFKPLFVRFNDQIQCAKDFNDAEKFKDSVEENSLFLSLVAKTKVEKAKEVYSWFQELTVVDFGNVAFESFITNKIPAKKIEDVKFKKGIESFLKAIDTGIKGIRIEKAEENKYKIYTKHKALDTNDFVEISLKYESSGTQKMFCLYNFFSDCIENGSVLFIDELDAKLHPLLLRYIVKMFNDPQINKNNAQLVFTTHDVSNLVRDLFRRDQIWFVEKNDYGVSNLYSLAEYKLDDSNKKVRNDASFSKDYIAGRYGAIPFLKEFNMLEEGE